MNFRATILDLDGTLIDSNDAHARAFVQAMAEEGIAVEFETVRRLIGKGKDKLLPSACGVQADSELGNRIASRKGRIFKEKFLPSLRPTRGARRLLEELRRLELQLVVATSAGREDLEQLLQAAGVADLIDESVTSDDADDSKPDPDILISALKQTGYRPDDAFMIGDTPYDVMAADRAGILIIALRCGGWDDAALRGAAAIYDDPAELLEHLDRSLLV